MIPIGSNHRPSCSQSPGFSEGCQKTSHFFKKFKKKTFLCRSFSEDLYENEIPKCTVLGPFRHKRELLGTGLRIGEALSLTMADVEISKCLLTIRNTKFFKTRWVPIGPQLTDELISYAEKRRQIPRPAQNRSAFFPTKRGDKLALSTIERIFRLLCENADIHRIDGGRFQPRLHDIRHTFALNRLISWYREGADVQRLLPFLSTYLGHIDVAATRRYLAMTPELLHEASLRFEQYAIEGGKP